MLPDMSGLFPEVSRRCSGCNAPSQYCMMCDLRDEEDEYTDYPIETMGCGGHSWINNNIATPLSVKTDKPKNNPFRAYRFTTDGM